VATDATKLHAPKDLLNECETIIGLDQANDPEPLKLFNAMQTKMQLMTVEVTKVAKAALKEGLVERAAQETAATAQGTSIAVDLQDIMKKLMREDNKGLLEEMVREYRKAVAPATDEQKDRSSASQPALEALSRPTWCRAEISTMGYEVSFYYAGRKPTGCGYDTYGLNGTREAIPEAFKRLLHKDHAALKWI